MYRISNNIICSEKSLVLAYVIKLLGSEKGLVFGYVKMGLGSEKSLG